MPCLSTMDRPPTTHTQPLLHPHLLILLLISFFFSCSLPLSNRLPSFHFFCFTHKSHSFHPSSSIEVLITCDRPSSHIYLHSSQDSLDDNTRVGNFFRSTFRLQFLHSDNVHSITIVPFYQSFTRELEQHSSPTCVFQYL